MHYEKLWVRKFVGKRFLSEYVTASFPDIDTAPPACLVIFMTCKTIE